MIATEKISQLDSILVGFAIPIFRKEGPDGRWLNGLGPEDWQRVIDGYGCPDCLAQFRMWVASCPLCGWVRGVGSDVQQAPDYWTQHLRDRADESYGVAEMPTQAKIEQALRDIHNDPDVEHTTMRKLKPRRRK